MFEPDGAQVNGNKAQPFSGRATTEAPAGGETKVTSYRSQADPGTPSALLVKGTAADVRLLREVLARATGSGQDGQQSSKTACAATLLRSDKRSSHAE